MLRVQGRHEIVHSLALYETTDRSVNQIMIKVKSDARAHQVENGPAKGERQ